MTAKTHLLAGILCGELICSAAGFSQAELRLSAWAVASAAFGAILPDIDHTGSKVSTLNRSTKNSSWMLGRIFHHRGPIHSPAFLALLLLAFWLCGALNSGSRILIAEAFSAGWLSHLVLDTFNSRGILWLWPFGKKRFHLAKIKSGAFGEWILAVLLLILIITYSSAVPALRLSLAEIRDSAAALGHIAEK